VAIGHDTLAALIYVAMAGYSLAFAASALRLRTARRVLFAAGFIAAAAAVAMRWHESGHPPVQNLFGVFLCLGAAVYPLSLLCRRVLKAGSAAFDAVIGFVVLFPAGFVFAAQGPSQPPPALQSPLLLPHVAAYVLAYVIMIMAAGQAFGLLLAGRDNEEAATRRELAVHGLVRFGFPLMTLGLVLGGWWGKLAWGRWWNWDPKELWSLATWLIFLGYLHFRRATWGRYRRFNAAIVLAGAGGIIITLLWANLARLFGGLHSYAL
jgi:ABC-type transport system involved in cytochrome c biogenesis permease subunit